jgi:hypothetical protein
MLNRARYLFSLMTLIGWAASANAIPIVVNITQNVPTPFGTQDSSMGSFSQMSPSVIEFTIESDFELFIQPQYWPFIGSGQGSLEYVNGTGCSMDHFSGLTSGAVAFLDQWGGCYYSDIVNNAAAAGAVGVVMGSNLADISGVSVGFQDPVSIASVLINKPLSTYFLDTLASPNTSIPAPTTLILFGLGVMALCWIRKTTMWTFYPNNGVAMSVRTCLANLPLSKHEGPL